MRLAAHLTGNPNRLFVARALEFRLYTNISRVQIDLSHVIDNAIGRLLITKTSKAFPPALILPLHANLMCSRVEGVRAKAHSEISNQYAHKNEIVM